MKLIFLQLLAFLLFSGKKFIIRSILPFLFMGCAGSQKKSLLNTEYLNPTLPVEQRVTLLLRQMTLDEKIGQMCQYVGEPAKQSNDNTDEMVGYELAIQDKAELIRQGLAGSFLKVPGYKEANYLQKIAESSRLKIPLLIATDAIHGHGMDIDAATIFPSPISIAAAFDSELATQIASVTAKEMRASGFHWSFSPTLDVVRDPRWGRTGETFGEDPLLVARLGIAMIRGYQGEDFSGDTNVLACAKHLVAGGIAENGLNGAPADVSERTLHEIFYPPFKKAVEEKVFTLMPSHNEVNGIPCHADRQMLTRLLRERWKFDGFIVSDWNDIGRLHTVHRIAETRKEADRLAVMAGVDMHMHGGEFFNNIKALVQEGKIPEKRIDEAVSKILEAKFRLGLFENRYSDEETLKTIVLSPAHQELALAAARKSIVLLKNEKNLLPLSTGHSRLFITGPNANDQSLLGDWARVQPENNVITILEGIQKIAGPETHIDYLASDGISRISDTEIAEAKIRAAKADISIVVAGENSLRTNSERTSGENLDRPTLELQGRQLELIKAIASAGKPIIVIMVNGAPISSEWCKENTTAIIEAWEPGMYGGQAVAEILYGKYNPSGKLPITIPRSTGHLKNYYNYKPSSYHRGKFKFSEAEPLFDFGYGLSYTSFNYSNLRIPSTIETGEKVEVTLDIENTGVYDGEETILLFLQDVYCSVTRPVKELKAFQKVFLKKGEKKSVKFTLAYEDLAFFNAEMKKTVEPGEFKVWIGSNYLSGSFRVREK